MVCLLLARCCEMMWSKDLLLPGDEQPTVASPDLEKSTPSKGPSRSEAGPSGLRQVAGRFAPDQTGRAGDSCRCHLRV